MLFRSLFAIPNLEMSDSAQDEFDALITSHESGDCGVLALSLSQENCFDTSARASMNQIEDAILLEEPRMEDDESTITTGTSYVKAIVHAADIRSFVIEKSPTFHTNSATAIRKTSLERSITPQPNATTIEHDDDETSINSQLIELLFGSDEILTQLEQSTGTWSEADRPIESVKIQELSLSIAKLNQSIDPMEKFCASEDEKMHIYPTKHNEWATSAA